MPSSHPDLPGQSAWPAGAPEQFATDVVWRLQAAGFVAYWAGGCVRDRLMQRPPKDFDVATNATPEQVRSVFGRRNTQAVGAAFGVILVYGPVRGLQVEVATFRQDLGYSDGRHPDAVQFTSPALDAQRRDFTINGIFYDPSRDAVIDYVGGEQDIRNKVVRAIGEPQRRFAEDKLRMLRAVRFAAVLKFELDAATSAAIADDAESINVVSGERIGDEMRKMLCDSQRARAVELLYETRLLHVLLPTVATLANSSPPAWQRTLARLESLVEPSFAQALAALLLDDPRAIVASEHVRSTIEWVRYHWKLANDESDGATWLIRHVNVIQRAKEVKWPELQRLMIQPGRDELLGLADAMVRANQFDAIGLEFCRQVVGQDESVWNPPPLINGNDLQELNIPRGPIYRSLLEQVRDRQLLGQIATRDDALQWVARSYHDS